MEIPSSEFWFKIGKCYSLAKELNYRIDQSQDKINIVKCMDELINTLEQIAIESYKEESSC